MGALGLTWRAGGGGIPFDLGTPPEQLGATFRLRVHTLPSETSAITTSGGRIVSAADVGGSGLTMAPSGTGPAFSAAAYNGFAGALFTKAGLETLICSSGLPAMGGDVDMTILVVAALLNAPSTTPYSVVGCAGDPGHATGRTYWLGETGGDLVAGVQNSPEGAVSTTAADNLLHVYGLEYSHASTLFTMRLDGKVIATGTATATTSAGGFPSKIGIWPQGSSFGTDAVVLDASWWIGASVPSATSRQKAERYYAKRCGVVK